MPSDRMSSYMPGASTARVAIAAVAARYSVKLQCRQKSNNHATRPRSTEGRMYRGLSDRSIIRRDLATVPGAFMGRERLGLSQPALPHEAPELGEPISSGDDPSPGDSASTTRT